MNSLSRRLVLALCTVASAVLAVWTPPWLIAVDPVQPAKAEPEAKAHGFVEGTGPRWSELNARLSAGPANGSRTGSVFLPPGAQPVEGLAWNGADRLLVRVRDADGRSAWLAARRLVAREASGSAPARLVFPLRRWAPLAMALGLLAWGWIPWPRRARESAAPNATQAAVAPDLLAVFLALFLVGLALLVMTFGVAKPASPAALVVVATVASIPSLWIWTIAAWHEALALERTSAGEYVLRWLGGRRAFRAEEVVSVEREDVPPPKALGCLVALAPLSSRAARAAVRKSHPVIRVHLDRPSLPALPVAAVGWKPMLARMRADGVPIDPSAVASTGARLDATPMPEFPEARPPRLRLAASILAGLLVLTGLLLL